MRASLRRSGALLLAVVAAAAWPFVLDDSTHFYGVLSVAYALVALSLTVLTGWARVHTWQQTAGRITSFDVRIDTRNELMMDGVSDLDSV